MKVLLLLGYLFIIHQQLTAQNVENKPHNFGFRTGAVYSLMNFNKAYQRPNTPVKNFWKPGLYVGALLKFPLNNNFLLQPEYTYSRMAGHNNRINTSYHFDYLSLPLLLKIKFTNRIHVLAGPRFDMLLSARKLANGIKNNITHDTEERSLALIAGIESALSNSLFVEARYMKGFNNIGIGQRSSVTEFKWDAIMVGLGMHF